MGAKDPTAFFAAFFWFAIGNEFGLGLGLGVNLKEKCLRRVLMLSLTGIASC